MATIFQPATKYESKLRLCLAGPAGSGKTFTALSVASAMSERIALIDTEHGSARKVGRSFNFETVRLDSYNPHEYVKMIKAAENEGFPVIVIDSLSHAWVGRDGVLQTKANLGDSFRMWGKAKAPHYELIEAILSSPAHIIATARSKVKYELIGKDVIKLGLEPEQDSALPFEFDIFCRMDSGNVLTVDKSRCEELPEGHVIVKPKGKDLWTVIEAWLSGDPPPPPLPAELIQDRMRKISEATGTPLTQVKADCLTALQLPTDTVIGNLDEEQLQAVSEWTLGGVGV